MQYRIMLICITLYGDVVNHVIPYNDMSCNVM